MRTLDLAEAENAEAHWKGGMWRSCSCCCLAVTTCGIPSVQGRFRAASSLQRAFPVLRGIACPGGWSRLCAGGITLKVNFVVHLWDFAEAKTL